MPDETPTPDENRPLREWPLLDDLTDYAHLLPEEFVTFVAGVEGWKWLNFETLLAEIAKSARQKELTLAVRDGMERVRRIQQIRNMDTEGDNVSMSSFLDRIKNPKVPPHIHTEVVQNLQNLFGCEHLFDVYVIGAENLRLGAGRTDETMNYIYETLVQSMISEVEELIEVDIQREQAETADADETDTHDETGKKGTVHVAGNYILDNHIHHPRKWLSKTTLVVAMILAGVAVKRDYVDFSRIGHDVRSVLKMIIPKDAPKAIPVTSEQMRAIEALDKQ